MAAKSAKVISRWSGNTARRYLLIGTAGNVQAMLSSTQPDPGRVTAPWKKVRELTGRSGGPPVDVPKPLVDRSHMLADSFAELSRTLGQRVLVHPADLLAERAQLLGLTRRSPSSCGGGAKLIRTHDGWVAVAMSRPDDLALLPAWLGDGDWSEVDPTELTVSLGVGAPWTAIELAVGARRTGELVSSAAELGLAVSALRESPAGGLSLRTSYGNKPRSGARLRVVELASLWAGPLCGRLLSAAGAEVIKVESIERPDGARWTPSFFEAMHPDVSFLQIPFSSQAGRNQLLDLVRNADVVIEGSRPRALNQLGIHAEELLCDAAARVSVWVSITGHGRVGANGNRVGYGDDAAVAGGLAVWDEAGPMFVADACADPLTGLAAATEALAVHSLGGSWLLDVSMSGVAAWSAGSSDEQIRSQ